MAKQQKRMTRRQKIEASRLAAIEEKKQLRSAVASLDNRVSQWPLREAQMVRAWKGHARYKDVCDAIIHFDRIAAGGKYAHAGTKWLTFDILD